MLNLPQVASRVFGTPLMIAQGHRPANFRPAPDTIDAIEQVMRSAGVVPPKAIRDMNLRPGGFLRRTSWRTCSR